MEFSFDAEIIHWRGPAPYFYAPVPLDQAESIRSAAKLVSYGWGVIPVEATVRGVTFTTSLFPRDGTYLLPLKDAVRKPTGITAGDTIHVEMTLKPRR
jgi:hypothetical protein